MPNRSLVNAIARSLLAGEATVEQAVGRLTRTLGRPWRWLSPLVRRYVGAMAGQIRPRKQEVVRFLLDDEGFQDACSRYARELSVRQWLGDPPKMQPAPAAANWDIPPIESVGALADWLQLSPGELEWFADLKGLGYKNRGARLRHYHYRILAKRGGSIRLIEAPKERLKRAQQQILTGILNRIPCHPAAHGFRRGRSVKTFVAPHVGKQVVVRMDLQDFFPSFGAGRIQTFFRTAGFPETVADLLGGICTNAAPRDIWRVENLKAGACVRSLYARPHLPQGAPTSPALANLCAFRLDCRLTGLATSAEAVYTRYADDLAFSGGVEFAKRVERFSTHVAAILLEEGFAVHHRKTRIMRQGVRQYLAGLTANQRINTLRPDFDRLKATLTNCVRLGPQSQNRDGLADFRSHLQGRVAWVESINPGRGKRLRPLLDRIDWSI